MVRHKSGSHSISSPNVMSVWRNRYAGVFFILLACALLIFSRLQPESVEKIHAVAGSFAAPVLDVASRPFAHLSEVTVQISNLAHLKSENERLRAENQKLREWYLRALALNTEVHDLRKMANLKMPQTQSGVSARVIADPGNSYVKSLLLAVGKQEGVREKQAVMASEGLIGRVISATQNSARILLLTDVGSRIPVYIEGVRQKAILSGNNDSTPLLTHMAKDVTLDEGARVLTSGHGGYFPVGLPVGKVIKMSDGSYGVKTFADMKNIMHVRIVQQSIDPNLIRANLDQ